LISDHNGAAIELSALEALMLLDVLTQEEEKLRWMAKASSPMPA
jgi:hypothetical protein